MQVGVGGWIEVHAGRCGRVGAGRCGRMEFDLCNNKSQFWQHNFGNTLLVVGVTTQLRVIIRQVDTMAHLFKLK